MGVFHQLTYQGDQVRGYFDNSVQVVGDVNGDGFPDLMIGAYQERSDTIEAGHAYLFFGSEKGLSPYADQVLEGDESQDRFGTSVSAAGNVNGDGYGDILVRSLDEVADYTYEGRAFLYLGSSDGLSGVILQIDEGQETSVGVSVPRRTVASGNFNGNSYGDFAIGSWQSGTAQEGMVYVYTGRAYEMPPSVIGMSNLEHVYLKPGHYILTSSLLLGENHVSVGSTQVFIEAFPTLDSWTLTPDTGNDSNDKPTNDTNPILTFVFSERVYRQMVDVELYDPEGNPVALDSVTGWGADTIVVPLATALTLEGQYMVVLKGETTIVDDADYPLNEGEDEVPTFTWPRWLRWRTC